MPTLSIVMIVKDEAENLPDCLNTVEWADEIVILDAGSEDSTLDIARRYTDKVYVDADWQGFGVQRQRAQAKASGDWIFMLDADERVTQALRTSIEATVAADERDVVYAVARLSWVFGRFIRHSGWYPDYVPRLYARERAGYRADRVHEKLVLSEGMQESVLSGDLLHYTYRDLNHYLIKSAHYAAAWAQQRQEHGKRASLSQGLFHGIGCFVKMYLLRAGFLDGRQGLLLALLSAHSTFAKYADLWVRSQSTAEAD
ncbi:glycosyltransferase [Candidatus Tenderia electrophaga]|jgi:(heptosyl)LPS beta-1,4-glucosyltransferase|uniref:Glycosyltransferase n=1 Tax=Candidatus Tenderia electrophaga TaxID=1748243 RepID=A0A0S2TAJ8_9GAMM|nr:glycosyltransferase [Candidatus Tenderia electrophaga]